MRQRSYPCKWLKDSITNSYIISLGTLNDMFPALSHAWLTLYSTSDEQGSRKTGLFTAVVWHTSRWQKIRQMPGNLVLTSYICLIFLMWLNLMYTIVLSLRIRYNDNRNRFFFDMRTISTVDFYRPKIVTLTLARYYFRFKLTQFDTFFVLSLRMKCDDNKN